MCCSLQSNEYSVSRLKVQGNGTALSGVRILAPIPRPTGVIMCIGKNYLDHVKEVDTWKSAPGITTPDAPKVVCPTRRPGVHMVLLSWAYGGSTSCQLSRVRHLCSIPLSSPKRLSQSSDLEVPSSTLTGYRPRWTMRQVPEVQVRQLASPVVSPALPCFMSA